jgi:hypothetical protein
MRGKHETGFTLSNQVPTPDIYGAHCGVDGTSNVEGIACVAEAQYCVQHRAVYLSDLVVFSGNSTRLI